MSKSTVIFDIDGVIVDSEQLHFDVLRALAPEQTERFSPQELIGLSLEKTLEHIQVPADRRTEILSRAVDTYRSKLSTHYLRPGVSTLTAALERQRIRFGFVSTAPRDVCLANIALLGLATPIQLISGDDVPRTKPHPDPYLAMLEQLGAQAGDAIVIEDTDLGIRSATLAGIAKVYAWPHALSAQQRYDEATAVINRLSDIADFQSLSLSDSLPSSHSGNAF
ncbi:MULTISPECIES: HAD family hydrolase [Burkholderia]|uniref:Hydrolase n=1 Tax=Burkholderia savannae TaxID=1637837 RepID=A0ABR5TG54_9BURK|nr:MULTISPECIES: HAD family phosphatase [Burkholderia]AOJ68657.1 hydrolase [Burkholderia savannae]KGS06899.1 HAD hydrolase, IA, variant 1 family protein [Burkholderia sp. ABCPW 111]KVG49869.1 hydrolase [Burkholderia sp. MSMB0265]KVG83596.1 hydrolase [Burkholderia sp. MSMB2040]KVG94396.1 hydrolase [Burkholderia sp. MSMB2041]